MRRKRKGGEGEGCDLMCNVHWSTEEKFSAKESFFFKDAEKTSTANMSEQYIVCCLCLCLCYY